ncbi:MAG TPA: HPr family phosphocarrier protein [Ruminococcaceae bacterium]|jgi:phosphocarrier protein|nr:HPr family phosphocarrier protein [Oscillospiraceae bacterium]
MTSQTVTVSNKIGIHARPASLLVNAASKFKSDITFKNGDRTAVAKSIISLLALQAKMNDKITIEANGSDEKDAVNVLAGLFNSKFGEE